MKSPSFYIILDLFFIILSLLLCSGFLYLLKQDDGTSLPLPVILESVRGYWHEILCCSHHCDNRFLFDSFQKIIILTIAPYYLTAYF
jgi:hypothetical protein